MVKGVIPAKSFLPLSTNFSEQPNVYFVASIVHFKICFKLCQCNHK